jgi:hypothetical protein
MRSFARVKCAEAAGFPLREVFPSQSQIQQSQHKIPQSPAKEIQGKCLDFLGFSLPF